MPLFKEILKDSFSISLWSITEPEEYFNAQDPIPNYTLESRRLQWYATRALTRNLFGNDVEILKRESGQPYLSNNASYISITHTAKYAGIMHSKSCAVGLDLETINEKVLRIAPKFLENDEIEAISESEKVQKLILYWSAKEALYKLYGKGGLEFKTQILIDPFTMTKEGNLMATIQANETWGNLKVHYEFFDNQVLTYVAKPFV